MGLMKTAKANFRRASRDAANVDVPDAGGRWGLYCSHARVMIERFEAAENVINYVQSLTPDMRLDPLGRLLKSNAVRSRMFANKCFQSLPIPYRVLSKRRCPHQRHS